MIRFTLLSLHTPVFGLFFSNFGLNVVRQRDLWVTREETFSSKWQLCVYCIVLKLWPTPCMLQNIVFCRMAKLYAGITYIRVHINYFCTVEFFQKVFLNCDLHLTLQRQHYIVFFSIDCLMQYINSLYSFYMSPTLSDPTTNLGICTTLPVHVNLVQGC